MPYDYSDAPPLQFDLIPQGKIATVSMHIRPGGAGEDGLLKRSRDGACEMLDIEFTVADTEFRGRKSGKTWFCRAALMGRRKLLRSAAAYSGPSSTPRSGLILRM